MLWDLYQQHQINQVEDRARDASARATRVITRIADLEDRVDSLALACQAMWELLSQRVPNADQVLQAKMQEVDGRDGRIDGKMRRVMTKCPACDRPLHSRHRRCMYCGEQIPVENLLQG